MFRVGPIPKEPIPKGSILMCYYCEEIIGRARRRIQESRATWTSYYYIDFVEEPDWTDICTFCNQHILNAHRMTKYFPADNIMSRIMMFLSEDYWAVVQR